MKLLELEDLLMVHEVGDDVYGDGEDDGAVVLGGDAVESLEVSQLKQNIELFDLNWVQETEWQKKQNS